MWTHRKSDRNGSRAMSGCDVDMDDASFLHHEKTFLELLPSSLTWHEYSNTILLQIDWGVAGCIKNYRMTSVDRTTSRDLEGPEPVRFSCISTPIYDIVTIAEWMNVDVFGLRRAESL
jgi:hypothetical protein